MKRCKARDENRWRCIRPEHEGDDHEYTAVSRIRLPKSQMALLHALKEALNHVERMLVSEPTYETLNKLQSRDMLLGSIEDLKAVGRENADTEEHRGHKTCYLNTDGTSCTSPKVEAP